MKRALILFLFATSAHAAIDPRSLAAHMRFLSSDALEGRETGTRGYEIAAEYVAAQFAAAGLQPLRQGWFQPIRFRLAKLDPQQSSVAIGARALKIGEEFVLRGDFTRPNIEAGAPVVLAGFGVSAPELKYDDYTGIDARGAIVLLVSGAPKGFPADQRAYYSNADVKRRNAAAHGAIGILNVQSITDERRYPFAKRAQQMGITPMQSIGPDGKPGNTIEQLLGNALLSRTAAEALFAGAPASLDAVLADAEKGIGRSFALLANASIRTVTKHEEASSANVIGTLRGNDPRLRDEYVVVSAHLDHLGNHPPATGGDGIYNGAYDNASGIAALTEIARAMAAGPRPKRSVIFVAFTGEEKGEQGSRYFAQFPPVPPGAIVADINMDMFLMLYPVADLVLLGGEHTTLGPLAARAAKESGFDVSPDPYPEEVRFIRSDQYAFVEQGVPAIHIKPGNRSRDGSIDGEKVTRDWLRNVYHSPRDDMSQTIDFASGARYAETNLRLARAVANGPRPAWVPGDFFARLFVAARP